MSFTVKCLFEPEILGVSWIPGELILVGAHESMRFQYVLGNCIVAGTKGLIPVAYFVPGGSTYRISKTMMGMIVGESVGDIEKDLLNDEPYPLYIDCSPHLTVEYLVERIFHMVKEHGVEMVVIDTLQDVDGSVFSARTKENEMTFILRILKNLADALNLVLIVTSQLSENVQWANETPQSKDILYVPFAEDLCNQIILIKSVCGVLEEAYQLILPKGFSFFDGEYGEMIINTVLDEEKGYFKKADKLFSNDVRTCHEDPMYNWYLSEADNIWEFGFLDASGMGCYLKLSPRAQADYNEYDISIDCLDGSHISIALSKPCDNMDKLKAFALREARRRFPEVEIPEKGYLLQ